MKSLIRKIILATIVATCLPVASFAAEFTLKYGHVGPVTSDDQVPGEFLKSFLESRSNGRIAVEIYPGAQLGNFRDMIGGNFKFKCKLHLPLLSNQDLKLLLPNRFPLQNQLCKKR